ncbi:MAG: ester cyclase [Gemmatimonadales bacterium]
MRASMIATATVALLTLAGCAPSPDPQLQANKDLVRRFVEATNAADWDGLTALVSEDLVRHSAATPGPPITSRDGFIELQKAFLQSFPDQKATVQRMVAEGDLVAVLATYTGTQTGPMGDLPATGTRVEAPFLGMLRIQDGRIVEMWVEWDNMAMMKQLGVTPPEPAS